MAQELRRTQEDRSAATRAALLAATVECLIEYGYAGTTTRLVADRAQVSRGAQTHHYPTKHDLVAAAIEQIFDQRASEFAAAFEVVPERERTLDRAVAALWDIVSGESYAAVLEVVVAARTDDELRVIVHATAASLRQTVVDLLLWFSPEITSTELAAQVVDLAFSIVQGAALSAYSGFGDPDSVVRFLAGLAALAPSLGGPEVLVELASQQLQSNGRTSP